MIPTKTRHPARSILLLLALIFTASAQVLAQPVFAPPSPVADELVELSPFVIRAEADDGYAPAETLSGTRLRAQGKDVASAMTIVTADFLRDIGAVNYNDVVNFMPSTAAHATNENDTNGNGFDFSVQADPNAQLPDGRPNPNVGQFYTEQAPKREKSRADVNQLRATLSYEKDFRHRKHFGRGLGRFTVADLYSNEATHSHLETLLEVNEAPLPGSVADLSDSRNALRRRWYFTPGATDYFVSDWRPINDGGIKSAWLPVVAPRNNFARTQSLVFAGQANLLDALVALTGGLRRDESLLSQTDSVKDARGVFSMGPAVILAADKVGSPPSAMGIGLPCSPVAHP
jgi:hypothetical protein